jgi:flagellar protein FliO/FliZ
MEAFFNTMSVPVKFLLAFIVVFAVLGAAGFLMRRFTGGNLSIVNPRGRQPRLGVIDAASVDGRRRLVLVRRDDVEHLLLIGGPTDIVVEPNIGSAAAAAPAPLRDARASPALEPPPRQIAPLEGSAWPPSEPAYVEPPPPRAVREAQVREAQVREAQVREAQVREAPVRDFPLREAQARDAQVRDAHVRGAQVREAFVRPAPAPVARQRLESLVEDAGAPPLLPTPPPEPEPAFPPVPPPFEPVFQIPPTPEPRRMPTAPPLPPRAPQSEESNLAEMAQRLEAALRRPIKPVEPVPSPPPAPRFTSEPAPLAMPPRPVPSREFATPPAPPATAREPVAPPFPKETIVPELKVVPADSTARHPPAPTPAFTSIEEEMASLLGRSTGKP